MENNHEEDSEVCVVRHFGTWFDVRCYGSFTGRRVHRARTLYPARAYRECSSSGCPDGRDRTGGRCGSGAGCHGNRARRSLLRPPVPSRTDFRSLASRILRVGWRSARAILQRAERCPPQTRRQYRACQLAAIFSLLVATFPDAASLTPPLRLTIMTVNSVKSPWAENFSSDCQAADSTERAP